LLGELTSLSFVKLVFCTQEGRKNVHKGVLFFDVSHTLSDTSTGTHRVQNHRKAAFANHPWRRAESRAWGKWKWGCSERKPYEYLANSIQSTVSPSEVNKMLEQLGCEAPVVRTYSFGAAACIVARKRSDW